MDIQRLRTFRSVVATGSVRAAATALDYSPSSVSQQMSQLQREVGVPLLQHVGRGVEPTAAGLALAARVDSLLSEVADLEDFAAGLRAGQTSTFSLGYLASLASTWLPPIVSPLTAEFPETRLHLGDVETFDPTRRPRIDLQIFVEPPDFSEPPGYQLIRVAVDPYVVALPDAHPLAARTQIALAELTQESWIDNAPDGPCRQVTTEACASIGFQPRYRLEVRDYAPSLALVAAGLGISVLPRVATSQLPDGVTIRSVVEPTPARQISALIQRATASSPVSLRAVELMHEAARAPWPGDGVQSAVLEPRAHDSRSLAHASH